MTDGRAIYKHLRAYLLTHNSSLTEFSANLGTSIPRVRWAVERYAGREHEIIDPMNRKILDATFQLLTRPSLPIHTILQTKSAQAVIDAAC
jgi:hypothetical protein